MCVCVLVSQANNGSTHIHVTVRQCYVHRDMYRQTAYTHYYTDIPYYYITYAHTHSQIVYYNWSVVNAPLRIKRQTGSSNIITSRLVILKVSVRQNVHDAWVAVYHIKLHFVNIIMYKNKYFTNTSKS